MSAFISEHSEPSTSMNFIIRGERFDTPLCGRDNCTDDNCFRHQAICDTHYVYFPMCCNTDCRYNQCWAKKNQCTVVNYERMHSVIQSLVEQGRVNVVRRSDGHVTTFTNIDGSTVTIGGYLCGQDFYEGWDQLYCKATKNDHQRPGNIIISLMIDTDKVPDMPEFYGCANPSACTGDDFHDFEITIHSKYVTDQF